MAVFLPFLAMAALMTAPAGATAPDTVVVASRGQTLRVSELDGTLELRSWERDAVRVEGAEEGRVAVIAGDGVQLRPRRPSGRAVALVVTVPRWMPVDVRGRRLFVTAVGLGAGATVATLEGDVVIRDVRGPVSVRTVDGEVHLEGVQGDADIRSIDEDVSVRRHRGTLEIVATDGDLILEDVVAEAITARTVDGDVTFTGVLRRGGRYILSTHSGDLDVGFPAGTGVTASISTFDGDFEAEFPVVLEGYRSGETTRFVLEDGGATLTLEAFDGEIRLFHTR